MIKRWSLIWIVAAIAVIVAVLIFVARSGGRGPLPGLSSIVKNIFSEKEEAETIEEVRSGIDVPDVFAFVTSEPVAALEWIPKSERFLAYGLDDRTLYLISKEGISQPVYQHSTEDNFLSANVSKDEGHLLILTSDTNSETAVMVYDLQTNTSALAPAGTYAAAWLPDGRLTFARRQDDKISIYLTEGPNFEKQTETARVPVSYWDGSLIPSPDGQRIAIIGMGGPFSEEALPAQLLSLDQPNIIKIEEDVANACWSPDSQYLFTISSSELINQDNPTITSWNATTGETSTITQATWFPGQLFSFPDKPNVYWTVQSAADDETDGELWGVTVINMNTRTIRTNALTPTLSRSIALFGLSKSFLFGLGTDSIYQTAINPFLDAAQATQ